MNPSPYYRPWLSATARGAVAPDDVVRGWLDALDDVLAGPNPRTDPAAGFDLIALAGKLRRVAPERLRRLDPRGLLDRADALAAANRAALLGAALGIANPAGWAARVAAAGHDPDPAVAAGEACNLLEELDDLELVWAAAEPTGPRGDPEVCAELFARRVDVFFPAGVFAQAVGAALRPDLETADPGLAWTARKFAVLLDALEAAEADAEPAPPLGGEVTPAAAPAPPPAGLIPALPSEYGVAAGAVSTLAPVPPVRWRAPDGGGSARLDFPPAPPADRRLRLRFRGAAPPAGTPVLLGGLRGVVGDDGTAGFDWDDVRAVEPMLDVLLVGSGKAAAWVRQRGG